MSRYWSRSAASLRSLPSSSRVTVASAGASAVALLGCLSSLMSLSPPGLRLFLVRGGEQVADLLKERLTLRRDVLLVDLGQFAEQFLLPLGQVARRLHKDDHAQLAAPAGADRRHAAAGDADHVAALGTGPQGLRV